MSKVWLWQNDDDSSGVKQYYYYPTAIIIMINFYGYLFRKHTLCRNSSKYYAAMQ